MKRLSLEKEITEIINSSFVSIPCNEYSKIEYMSTVLNGRKYEYYKDFEEELKKRARSMFRKKQEKYQVPKSQNILLVFSNHRGMVKQITEAAKKCTKHNISHLLNIGLTEKEAIILTRSENDMVYALSTMPKAYY